MLVQFRMYGQWWYSGQNPDLTAYFKSGLPLRISLGKQMLMEIF